jgi:hypothetical protein
MSEIYKDFVQRQEEKHAAAYELEAKKTEFKSSALAALAWSEVVEPEFRGFYTQKAIAYSVLELARVSGRSASKK